MLLFFLVTGEQNKDSKRSVLSIQYQKRKIHKQKLEKNQGLGWSINKKILDNEKRLNPRFVRQDNLKKGA